MKSRVYLKTVRYCHECPDHDLNIDNGGTTDRCQKVLDSDGRWKVIRLTPHDSTWTHCEIPEWCPLEEIIRFEDVKP